VGRIRTLARSLPRETDRFGPRNQSAQCRGSTWGKDKALLSGKVARKCPMPLAMPIEDAPDTPSLKPHVKLHRANANDGAQGSPSVRGSSVGSVGGCHVDRGRRAVSKATEPKRKTNRCGSRCDSGGDPLHGCGVRRREATDPDPDPYAQHKGRADNGGRRRLRNGRQGDRREVAHFFCAPTRAE
jgi:hypothetical protein